MSRIDNLVALAERNDRQNREACMLLADPNALGELDDPACVFCGHYDDVYQAADFIVSLNKDEPDKVTNLENLYIDFDCGNCALEDEHILTDVLRNLDEQIQYMAQSS